MSDRTLAEQRWKFQVGRLVATPGAIVALEFNGFNPYDLLQRHVKGDYGDLTDEDKRLNDEAIETGGRILSAYNLAGGERIWVLTEADRSATTFLLPSEY